MSCVTTVNSTPISSASATTVHQNMAPGASAQQSIGNVPHAGITNTPVHISGSSNCTSVLNKQRLQELVNEVDPNEQLDDDVEELLLQIADDFIENVVTSSCMLAKHRNSDTLEVKDVELILEKNWKMWIPGFGSEEPKHYKKSATTDAHKQRLNVLHREAKK